MLRRPRASTSRRKLRNSSLNRLFRSFLAKFIVVFVVLCIVAYLTVTILRGHNRNKYYRRRR